MRSLKVWFALAIGIVLGITAGCSRHDNGQAASARGAPDRSENADAFVTRANGLLENDLTASQRAQQAATTASDPATQKLVTDAEANHLALLDRLIAQSAGYDGQTLKPEAARAFERLRLWNATPIPHDPAKIAELAAITVRMRWTGSVDSYCRNGDATSCRSLPELLTTLRDSRDYDQRLDAWSIRLANTAAMRKDYARLAELANDGAKRLGFANAGEYARARYDMDTDELRTQTDRLWSQVKPLHDQLQCYIRARLVKHYSDRAQADGLIRAHLAGGLASIHWNNQWDLLAPYPDTAQPATDATSASDGASASMMPASGNQPFLFRHRNGDPLASALLAATGISRATTNPPSSPQNEQSTIDEQMRSALEVFTTLAFSMASEHWRWGVYDGSIKPADYNKAWWAMRAKYEGITPPAPRDERSFDAGAAEVIAENQPQSSDLLAVFLAYQIDRALCRTSHGPRYGCDLERDPAAGNRYRAMLARDESQPWPKTLKEFTGEDSIDAGALLEYFRPLRAWLERQNKGEACGWEGNFASGPSAPHSE
jgi:hypothetical protein